MFSKRVQHVLAVVVMLLMVGASSQAAVCELACGVQVQAMGCHSAGVVKSGQMDAMGMSHAHCEYRRGVSAMQGPRDRVMGAGDAMCGHASLPDMAKGSSAAAIFSAMQWVAVTVVPVDWRLLGVGGVERRVPVPSGGGGSLLIGLRV